jgi:hypothetical protein
LHVLLNVERKRNAFNRVIVGENNFMLDIEESIVFWVAVIDAHRDVVGCRVKIKPAISDRRQFVKVRDGHISHVLGPKDDRVWVGRVSQNGEIGLGQTVRKDGLRQKPKARP